jgi:hypothetical protein
VTINEKTSSCLLLTPILTGSKTSKYKVKLREQKVIAQAKEVKYYIISAKSLNKRTLIISRSSGLMEQRCNPLLNFIYLKKEAKQLAKENDWDKLHALLYLRSKYENENRTEEAAIVSKLIHEEEADEIREYDGF